jgi:hypothetical protein
MERVSLIRSIEGQRSAISRIRTPFDPGRHCGGRPGMIRILNYCRTDPQIAMLGSPGFGSRQEFIEISMGRFFGGVDSLPVARCSI